MWRFKCTRPINYHHQTNSLAHVYRKIRASEVSTLWPSDLVFAAASVIGKSYIGDAKRAHGVASDVCGPHDE